MARVAALFPGQGSQKRGMAAGVLDLPGARQRFDRRRHGTSLGADRTDDAIHHLLGEAAEGRQLAAGHLELDRVGLVSPTHGQAALVKPARRPAACPRRPRTAQDHRREP